MQPSILTVLSLAQGGKFFSHFGVRTLLILYLVTEVGYSDTHAFGMSAVFCSLVELASVFGGMMADRYLGLHRATTLGGWILTFGYLSLVLEQGLLISMGLIIVGGSLFSSNITALLGLSYEENDPKREWGFTVFYMMQNLGALISTILCGLVAMHYGFRVGFIFAAIGMLLSNVVLLLYRKKLSHLGAPPTAGNRGGVALLLLLAVFAIGTFCIWTAEVVLPVLPFLTSAIFLGICLQLVTDGRWKKGVLWTFFIYLAALILFFAVEDQICSSLILFVERHSDRTFMGFSIPSSWITAVNPIVIILLGSLVAKMRGHLALPFMITGLSFGVLSLACLLHVPISILSVMGVVIAISVAELMLGPMIFSYASEVAVMGRSGLVMGLVPVAFSLAFQLSGWFSKMVAIEDQTLSMHTYGIGFGTVTGILFAAGFLLCLLMKKVVRSVYDPA